MRLRPTSPGLLARDQIPGAMQATAKYCEDQHDDWKFRPSPALVKRGRNDAKSCPGASALDRSRCVLSSVRTGLGGGGLGGSPKTSSLLMCDGRSNGRWIPTSNLSERRGVNLAQVGVRELPKGSQG